MRNSIFRKAKELVSKVVEVGEGARGKHFKFFIENSPIICIKVEDNCTIITCTCKHCSTKSDTLGLLCSYKLAILLYELR